MPHQTLVQIKTMKLFAAVLVALPLLVSSSRVGNPDAESQVFLPRSESEVPAPAPGSDYDYEADYADVDEGTQADEVSSTPSPDTLRDADDEAAKERRRLANLRRRFTLPFYQRHKNETSEASTENEEEVEEEDIPANSEDNGTEVAEGPEEEREDERPTPYRPRRRFGGRHQASQADSEVASEDAREIQDPYTSESIYRPRGRGHFSGRHQADEAHSESAPDEEDIAVQDSEAGDLPFRPRGTGRLGGRRHGYESDSQAALSEENGEIVDSEANAGPYRRKGIGRFGGRQQEHELESGSRFDSEGSEVDDEVAAPANVGRQQADRLGGAFGRSRQKDQSESESIRNNGSEGPNETDEFPRSSSSAPVRGLAGLLNSRFSNSRIQNDRTEGVEEELSNGGAAASEGEAIDVEYTDDEETQFPSNHPQPGGLRSRYQ